MAAGYHHVTRDIRCQIYALKSMGQSLSKIALAVGRDKSTISREISRNTGGRGYRFKQADGKAKARRSDASQAPKKLTRELQSTIREKLLEDWSPDQISGRLKLEGKAISHETIYQFVWRDKRAGGKSLAGYQRVDKVDEQSPEQVYVVIPASMGSDQKRERLCNAFEYGAIVVQEEGNSAFSFERLLNDLLMGKHPQGLLPKQPGFLYLQTQNPSEKFAGRVKMSNALARRTLKIDIPPYNGQDVFEILQYRGIDKSTARQLAAAYVHNEKLAISEKKDPPNLRDVLQLVEKIPPKLPEKRNREKEEPDLSGEMKRLKL